MESIQIRKATMEDKDAIYALMKRVFSSMEHPEWFVCDSADFVEQHISEKGFVSVACTKENTIVGSFIVRYPGKDADNLGIDIGLSEEDLQHVVHMESYVVDPEYRGLHLAEKMLLFCESMIDKNQYTYYMATVHPDNMASASVLENQKYMIVKTTKKYGENIRNIFVKKSE